MAASRVASWPPGVSWVCRWTGRSNRSRSAVTSVLAAGRAQQARHVLDRQDVRARVDDLLGQPQVVVEGVEPLGRVGQVAGVAERDLGDGRPGGAHGVDRGPHLADVVERVEDAEDVDAGRRRLLDERLASPRPGRGCSRPCCGRAAASAGRCSGPPRAGRPAAATGPRPGSAARRRRSRRPRPRATAARAWSARRGRPRSSRSRVRTRVASSDWCASRNVVSVTATARLGAQLARELRRARARAGAGATRPAAAGAGRPPAAC